MRKYFLLFVMAMILLSTGYMGSKAFGEENMMQKMMEMGKKNFQQSLDNGKELYEDSSLGTTGLTCKSCHPKGGTAGGRVEMTYKGKVMKPMIPILKGAAAHFPAPRGPERKVVTLKGMNNLCIKAFLKGNPLDENNNKANDLANYVSTFSVNVPLTPNGRMIYE